MKAKDVRQVAHWAWGMIWNPPLVWNNQDGTFSHAENVRRFKGQFTRWDMRPLWFHTAFTKRRACGCRKRWWGTPTIWCMDCARLDLDADL